MMTDPVVDAEGNTYERIAIESWIDMNHTSPITRNKIVRADLRPNRSLKNAIAEQLESGEMPPRIDSPSEQVTPIFSRMFCERQGLLYA